MKKGLRRGKSSESLEKSPKEESGKRKRRKSLSLSRDRSLPREKKDLPREPSISSIGREVRCACQYFQSDKLLPERISLFGSRPPSIDMAQSVGEHVYEPINPPPLSTEKKPETPRVEITEKAVFKGSSIPETEKSITRIPSEHDLPKKESIEKAEAKSAENVAEDVTAQEIQDAVENRFLAPSPSAAFAASASYSQKEGTPTTTDTSGFEDLPVRQSTLVKTRREQMRAQAAEIQQRLRNHAGRIRDRFSHIQRPSLGRKERSPRDPQTAEKSRFRLPEMHAPKINLPDRSKFKLPEKAKFHLPESAKFQLPDRSKFHLPEKGKFHLPERPKLNLAERARAHFPERGKFHLPDKSKFHLPDKSKFHLPEKAKFHLPDKAKFHLPDKSKFHLPEKAKFHLPEKAKFHLPDKSKFHLPERAKFSLPNRPKIELPKLKRAPREGESSPKTVKSRFDFDIKSYPKLFTKQSKHYTTSSPKQTRGRTPPPRMKAEEMPGQSSDQWKDKMDDLKYVDDDLESAGARETDSRKSESLFEREGYVEDFEKIPQEIRTISTKSSASRLSDKDISESSDDRKKGVLEEINPDEFFLRQKGISQDDIDMGQYLSREIREAFRSPDVNALAKMDYMDVDDENIDPQYQGEPTRPKRTGSIKKKSILKKTFTSDPNISDDGYKTYPPRRPGRKSRSQSKSLLNEEAVIDSQRYEGVAGDPQGYEEPDVNMSRYDNMEYDNENLSEYYKSPGPAIEYQHYKVPRPLGPISPSPPVKRRSSMEDEGSHKRVPERWEEEVLPSEPPKPAARKKHKKKATESESFSEEQIPQETFKAPEEVVPEPPPQVVESPVPPKRTRTRSAGSRSLRSLATEDDVNRSFRSEPPIERLEEFECQIITEETQQIESSPLVKSASEFLPSRTHEYEITDLDDAGFGYATIGKPTVTKPERQKKTKPERPPPPRRKKEVSVPIYNTYPRRAPVRPLRNYSTLGPSRPPRGKKISPIEKTLSERQLRTSTEVRHPTDFTESLDAIEVSDGTKELQTERVIEKMKGRPLPPPPRPPRQKSREPEDIEPTEEEKLSLSILKDEEFPLERTVTAFVHEPPADREIVEEICTATQTDPLPEDFSFGTDEGSDMIQEFSHEQLRIQQAFLEEMKREEEEIRQRGKTNEGDLIDAELKAEVIRQIEDIIAEEKRILEERKSSERFRREESAPEGHKDKSFLDVDADMGYASLERRPHKQDNQSSTKPNKQQYQPAAPQEYPQKLEKLQVEELEVGTLNVREVQSDQIFVKELQSNRIASQDIDNTGGTMSVGNVNLPPAVIDQIVAKIPWENIRQEQQLQSQPEQNLLTPPVRPQRRARGSHQEESDEEAPVHHKKGHRRHHRVHHSSEEEGRSSERMMRRHVRRSSESPKDIPELSLQLARACTSAGVQALKNFVQTNAAFAQSLDRELCVQAVLCVAVALIAAFFLFGFDAKIIHTHRWDFQFPPQPPNAGI